MNKHNKKIALACVIALVIILLIPLSYAAYTSVTSARRVVSTANAADSLFSSNYLSILPKGDMGKNNAGSKEHAYKNRYVSYQTGSETQAVYVSVCNYAQGYLAKWSDKDINYHIEFSLVDLENHELIDDQKTYKDTSGNTIRGADILKKNFKVSADIATSGSENIPCTYTGKSLKYVSSSGSQDMYTVFLDTTYADIVGVKIEVITEDNSPAYSGYGLGGVLCLSGYVTEASSGWNGEIQETSANVGDLDTGSEKYTGFNYEVSGAGAGTVTVTWDEKMFAISDIFLEDMEKYITSKTNNSISFKVGEADQDDRFFIQFYRVSQSDKDEKWEKVKSAFSCSFTKSE